MVLPPVEITLFHQTSAVVLKQQLQRKAIINKNYGGKMLREYKNGWP